MKKAKPIKDSSEMRDEYDFSGGMRGKYASRMGSDVKLVRLDPDIAAAFSSGKAVNRALRTYLEARRRKSAKRHTRAKRAATN
jgi:hypothetical protein